MRAYKITPGAGIEALTRVDLPDPQPGPHDVLIRVRATSLNFRDLLAFRRATGAIVPLSDGAGDVVAVGGEVTEFAPGDRVAGCFFRRWPDGDATPARTRDALGGGDVDGVLAEYVALPEQGVVRAPSHMTHEETATLPCAAVTAWNAMFEETRLLPGHSVLLLGTGGVSMFGLQLAKLAGLRAIVTSSSDEKLERARALGADVTVNYREREDWDQAVREASGGRGVDLVLEVAGAGTFARSMAATRFGGSVVLIGLLTEVAGETGPVPLVARSVHATRVYVGSKRMFEDMNRALELHEMRPVIDRVFEFDDAPAAYRYLESQAHVGKVVIRLPD